MYEPVPDKIKYNYLEHVADAKFEAFGSDYDELFVSCAYALENLMVSLTDVEEQKIKKINLASDNLISLLYDFLDELIFMLEVDRFVFSRILKIEIDSENFTLFVKFIGSAFDSTKAEIKNNVKAVTYNEMKIEKIKSKTTKSEDILRAVVVVDL